MFVSLAKEKWNNKGGISLPSIRKWESCKKKVKTIKIPLFLHAQYSFLLLCDNIISFSIWNLFLFLFCSSGVSATPYIYFLCQPKTGRSNQCSQSNSIILGIWSPYRDAPPSSPFKEVLASQLRKVMSADNFYLSASSGVYLWRAPMPKVMPFPRRPIYGEGAVN